jgi:hypothetical protein
MTTVLLPNLASVPFGRSNPDDVAALVGYDLRSIAPRDQGQYRRIGSDPCQYYTLPDGRVVLVRSRQITARTQVVIFASGPAWTAWCQADGRGDTYWGVAETPA